MTYFKDETEIHFMEDYKELLSAILESQKEFIGDKQALAAARRSSLELSKDGHIQDFYGEGPVAAKVLLQVFFRQTGQAGLNYTRRYLHSRDMEIPKEVDPPERNKDMLDRFLGFLSSLKPSKN